MPTLTEVATVYAERMRALNSETANPNRIYDAIETACRERRQRVWEYRRFGVPIPESQALTTAQSLNRLTNEIIQEASGQSLQVVVARLVEDVEDMGGEAIEHPSLGLCFKFNAPGWTAETSFDDITVPLGPFEIFIRPAYLFREALHIIVTGPHVHQDNLHCHPNVSSSRRLCQGNREQAITAAALCGNLAQVVTLARGLLSEMGLTAPYLHIDQFYGARDTCHHCNRIVFQHHPDDPGVRDHDNRLVHVRCHTQHSQPQVANVFEAATERQLYRTLVGGELTPARPVSTEIWQSGSGITCRVQGHSAPITWDRNAVMFHCEASAYEVGSEWYLHPDLVDEYSPVSQFMDDRVGYVFNCDLNTSRRAVVTDMNVDGDAIITCWESDGTRIYGIHLPYQLLSPIPWPEDRAESAPEPLHVLFNITATHITVVPSAFTAAVCDSPQRPAMPDERPTANVRCSRLEIARILAAFDLDADESDVTIFFDARDQLTDAAASIEEVLNERPAWQLVRATLFHWWIREGLVDSSIAQNPIPYVLYLNYEPGVPA